eukprot:m51a1_g11580 putative C-tail anchored protein (364) ;mRNA; r:44107-45848
MLALLLAAALSLSLASAASPSTPLRFRDTNRFRITAALVRLIVGRERPDLVVVTGDSVCSDEYTSVDEQRAAWSAAMSLYSSLGRPWALTMGNHEQTGFMSLRELAQMAVDAPGSLTQTGPAEAFGETNYVLPVYGRSRRSGAPEAQPAALLWVLSVTHQSCEGVRGSGCVTASQVSWFNTTSQLLSRSHSANAEPLPSFMFFHIPTPEYGALWRTETCVGAKNERVYTSKVNTGVYEAALRNGVRGIFVGHDHVNDYCCSSSQSPQLRLCYGRKTGFGYYNPRAPMRNGARVIELELVSGTDVAWRTWVVDAGGVAPQSPHEPTQYPAAVVAWAAYALLVAAGLAYLRARRRQRRATEREAV